MHDVSDMVVFVEVVRQGGFSAASRHLGLASSVVSDRVKALELRLGMKLLHRTTRSQALTEGGQVYLEHARCIVADIEAMEALVLETATAPRGPLRVTAPGPLGQRHMAPLVGQFSQAHPHIQVHLTLDDRFSDIVGEGFDVAVRGGPLIDSQFTGRRLFDTRRVVVASPAYLKRAGVPATPRDLPQHRCLVFNHQGHFHADWRFGRGAQAHTLRLDGALATTHSELPISWALQGLGLTQKSWWEVAEHVAQGNLRTVLEVYEPDPVSFYAIHPVRAAQSRKVGLFVEALVAWFEAFE
ncbi:LysR family transcriptional regulator [Pseudomonas abieticivorans]|uniref:LysR family transcriptional regulator n=1 Tax=Pseudomonas abieticivorans TaxID=2931382 RepID=UPI0020C01680|nr:LysR family transcriptional regulator [Pseudomonas sp. PIA16]